MQERQQKRHTICSIRWHTREQWILRPLKVHVDHMYIAASCSTLMLLFLDELEREAKIAQISNFGQTPKQLFKKPHPGCTIINKLCVANLWHPCSTHIDHLFSTYYIFQSGQSLWHTSVRIWLWSRLHRCDQRCASNSWHQQSTGVFANKEWGALMYKIDSALSRYEQVYFMGSLGSESTSLLCRYWQIVEYHRIAS